MITIQELHAYQNLISLGEAEAFICPINESDGSMISWFDENKNEPILWCLSCNTKKTFSYNEIKLIKSKIN